MECPIGYEIIFIVCIRVIFTGRNEEAAAARKRRRAMK